MSFNYPVSPTKEDKLNYKNFILNLQYILPCKYCRINLRKNLRVNPLKLYHLKNRESFSRYVYNLHEIVNSMLGKKSGLTYADVRERYEHFRSRCMRKKVKLFNFNKTKKVKESGCVDSLYDNKSKCIIKIVPNTKKCKTLTIDRRCMKSKV